MIKPKCLRCGSTDIEWTVVEDKVTGTCRNCGTRLVLKRRAEKPGIVSFLRRLFRRTEA